MNKLFLVVLCALMVCQVTVAQWGGNGGGSAGGNGNAGFSFGVGGNVGGSAGGLFNFNTLFFNARLSSSLDYFFVFLEIL
jgi:hypothetical protein